MRLWLKYPKIFIVLVLSRRKTNYQSATRPQSLSESEYISLLAMTSNRELSSFSLREVSPVALAYIGDAVYELYIRCFFLFPSRKIADYHQKVVEQVRAETQASHLQTLRSLLTDVELDWVRRGRNAVNKSPRRLPLQTYQQASGLETLLGYLYITDPLRLQYLLRQLEIKQNSRG